MGTRNIVWARHQGPCGGPLAKLLFLHICDAIPERGDDPCLETSLGYLAHYAETDFWEAIEALDKLVSARLIRFSKRGDRLFLRIPFPST